MHLLKFFINTKKLTLCCMLLMELCSLTSEMTQKASRPKTCHTSYFTKHYWLKSYVVFEP